MGTNEVNYVSWKEWFNIWWKCGKNRLAAFWHEGWFYKDDCCCPACCSYCRDALLDPHYWDDPDVG